MSIWNDLKFGPQELEAKSISTLADRPNLSADQLKERLDSGDIRLRFNQLLDRLEEKFSEEQ